ncbi:MAG: hypothetical protein D3924_09790 [Candidatus Electrothrix sp. AR4]|nr:hypothetical protein [Candidatus Electrothrix sp. AR4]
MTSHASEPGRPVRPKSSIRTLLALLRPIYVRYRYRLLLGFLALLGVDFLQLTIPKYLKFGVDSLSDGTATNPGLLLTGSFLLLTAAGIALLRFVWRILIVDIIYKGKIPKGNLNVRVAAPVVKANSDRNIC